MLCNAKKVPNSNPFDVQMCQKCHFKFVITTFFFGYKCQNNRISAFNVLSVQCWWFVINIFCAGHSIQVASKRRRAEKTHFGQKLSFVHYLVVCDECVCFPAISCCLLYIRSNYNSVALRIVFFPLKKRPLRAAVLSISPFDVYFFHLFGFFRCFVRFKNAICF